MSHFAVDTMISADDKKYSLIFEAGCVWRCDDVMTIYQHFRDAINRLDAGYNGHTDIVTLVHITTLNRDQANRDCSQTKIGLCCWIGKYSLFSEFSVNSGNSLENNHQEHKQYFNAILHCNISYKSNKQTFWNIYQRLDVGFSIIRSTINNEKTQFQFVSPIDIGKSLELKHFFQQKNKSRGKCREQYKNLFLAADAEHLALVMHCTSLHISLNTEEDAKMHILKVWQQG